eukprot:g3035.t1
MESVKAAATKVGDVTVSAELASKTTIRTKERDTNAIESVKKIKNVPIKSLEKDMISYGKKTNSLENRKKTFSAKVTDRMATNANLSMIFHAWDSDRNDSLSILEIQAGLFRAGILVSHKRMLRMCGRILNKSIQGSGKDVCIDAEMFPKFIALLCNGDMVAVKHIVMKLIKSVPTKPIRPKAFLKLSKEGKKITSPKKKNANDDSSDLKTDRSEKRLDVVAKTARQEFLRQQAFSPQRLWEILTFQRGAMPAFVAFLVWQFSFTLWYVLYCDFRFARAFYYSAQAGLSIGFGALSEEAKGGILTQGTDCENDNVESASYYDVSKFVTCINVLLGSSLIGGALGFFVNTLLEKRESWYAELYIEKKGKKPSKANGSKRIVAVLDPIRNISSDVKLFIIVLSLLIAAIVVGMVHEDWTFITSLYYGITSMSTAGLQAPNPESDFSMVFTGLLALFGVPLYAVCLGTFAHILVAKNEEARNAAKLEERISMAEFNYAQKVGHMYQNEEDDDDDGSSSQELTRLDFLTIELLRCGKCEIETIRKIGELFEDFDADESGFVTWIEITANNVFQIYDTDGSGEIDYAEFKAC